MTEPAGAGEPASAVTQSMTAMRGRCAQCAAALVDDQRYCLQCGEPRPHLAGPPPGLATDRVAGLAPGDGSVVASPGGKVPLGIAAPGAAASGASGPSSSPPGYAPPGHQAGHHSRNNSVALIAGVGVLLLAMGVGVLIGRAGVGSAKAPPAQVISVGGTAGATGALATPTTTAPTPQPPATPASKKKQATPKLPAGTGSSITKPAPPSAAQNLRSGGSGQSYEQKSKNLPNVVSTG